MCVSIGSQCSFWRRVAIGNLWEDPPTIIAVVFALNNPSKRFGLVWFYFSINQHLKEHSKIYVKEIRLVAHFNVNMYAKFDFKLFETLSVNDDTNKNVSLTSAGVWDKNRQNFEFEFWIKFVSYQINRDPYNHSRSPSHYRVHTSPASITSTSRFCLYSKWRGCKVATYERTIHQVTWLIDMI